MIPRDIRDCVREFVGNNRQTGSTTALVEAVIRSDGILVVHSMIEKRRIIHNYPMINPESVLSVTELDSHRGHAPRKIFFDTAVLCFC